MRSMTVTLQTALVTRRPLGEYKAPWLKGRGPHREVVEDFVVKVWTQEGRNEVICVPSGYIFDGASIPWYLWWLFPPGYDPAWEAACVHDFIYSHLHKWYSKDFADRLFREIMLEMGANKAVAQGFYLAVHTFGKGGW